MHKRLEAEWEALRRAARERVDEVPLAHWALLAAIMAIIGITGLLTM